MNKPMKKELKFNSSTEEYICIGYNQCYDDFETWLPSILKDIEKAEWLKKRGLNPDSEEYIDQYKKAQMTSEIIEAISTNLKK